MATHHGKTGIYFPARLGVDTDAYDYRWKTPGGDVYYMNNENDNPNTFLHQTVNLGSLYN